MKSVSAKQLRQELSEVLEQVQNGEKFVIIYHSKPVGEIIPLNSKIKTSAGVSIYDFLEEPFGEIKLKPDQTSTDLVKTDRR